MRFNSIAASCAVSCFFMMTSGCAPANMTSIYRTTAFSDKATVISIDAKQRVIATKKTTYDFDVFCAEPSPDALVALSGAVSGSASVPQTIAIEITNSLKEHAQDIGLRTQSIQLLRDAMFRTCEGYFNGALNAVEFLLLHQRYQDLMIAVMAIEQLTGAARKDPAKSQPSGTDRRHMDGVAVAVREIVKSVIEKDYTLSACFSYLSQTYKEKTGEVEVSLETKTMRDFCRNHIQDLAQKKQ